MKSRDGMLMILGTVTGRPGFKHTLTCAYTYWVVCACGERGWNSSG